MADNPSLQRDGETSNSLDFDHLFKSSVSPLTNAESTSVAPTTTSESPSAPLGKRIEPIRSPLLQLQDSDLELIEDTFKARRTVFTLGLLPGLALGTAISFRIFRAVRRPVKWSDLDTTTFSLALIIFPLGLGELSGEVACRKWGIAKCDAVLWRDAEARTRILNAAREMNRLSQPTWINWFERNLVSNPKDDEQWNEWMFYLIRPEGSKIIEKLREQRETPQQEEPSAEWPYEDSAK